MSVRSAIFRAAAIVAGTAIIARPCSAQNEGAATEPGHSVRLQSRERPSLIAWDDSLQAITSAHELDAFRVSGNTPGGARAVAVRRALYQIRRGDLQDDAATVDLAMTNGSVMFRHVGSDPWGPYVIARGALVSAQHQWIERGGDGTRVAERFGDAIWRNLNASLAIDRDFAPARHLLISLAMPSGDRTLNTDQVAAFAREVARPAPDPAALIVWGRHLRGIRNDREALAVFDRAQHAGADSSLIALEEARVHSQLGDTASAHEDYWRGAASLTDAGRELYRFDLAWIVSRDSLAAFDRLPADSVQSWLHRFWFERDASAAREPGERLLEHLRRWNVANREFRVIAPWRYTTYDRVELTFEGLPFAGCVGSDASLYDELAQEPPVHAGDIRHREPLLDHRGLIYLRHGEPLMRFGWEGESRDTAKSPIHTHPPEVFGRGKDGPRIVAAGSLAISSSHNASWLYLIDGELRMLHFRGSLALGEYGPTTLTGYLPVNPALWSQRVAFSGYAAAVKEMLSYQRAAEPADCLPTVRSVIAESRVDARAGIHNDTDSPPVLYPWQSVVQAFALGSGADQDGEALVSFALSPDSLVGIVDSATHSVSYPLHFRLVAYNPATSARVTLDSTRTFATGSSWQRGAWLTGAFELGLGPGQWQVAVRVRQEGDSSGVFTLLHRVVVNNDEPLMLSDIVTGIPGASPWTATDGAPFPVNALNGWYPGQVVELFYEVHGLAPSAPFTTSIEVHSNDSASHLLIAIQSNDVADGPATRLRKTLALDHLAAGTYRLVVKVTAGTHVVTRDHVITIVRRP